MRLIDADALPVVTEVCVDEAGFFAKFNVVHEEDIVKAPTIEAEPVRHGRWLQTQEPLGWHEVDCFECSNCHESWILDEDYSFDEITWKYCPNCGARMDGESK